MLSISLQTYEDNKLSVHWHYVFFSHANYQRKTENTRQVKQTTQTNKLCLCKCNSAHYITLHYNNTVLKHTNKTHT